MGSDRKSTRLNSSHAYISYSLFFFNAPATTEISPLSLHDALPICRADRLRCARVEVVRDRFHRVAGRGGWVLLLEPVPADVAHGEWLAERRRVVLIREGADARARVVAAPRVD